MIAERSEPDKRATRPVGRVDAASADFGVRGTWRRNLVPYRSETSGGRIVRNAEMGKWN